MLIPSPILQLQIQQIVLQHLNDVWSGEGITEANMATEPALRAQNSAEKVAQDITNAVDAWIQAIIFTVPPGLQTAGSPTNHFSIVPWIVTKT